MSAKVRAYRSGGYEVDIHTTAPDGTWIRERVVSPVTGKEATKAWAAQREAHLALRHGEGGCRCKVGRAHAPDDPKQEEVTVEELVDRWLTRRKERGVPSEPEDRQRLTHYVVPILGRMNASEVKPRHVEAFIQELLKRPSRKGGTLAPRTVRGTYFLLKQVFQMAVVKEWVLANPVVVESKTLPEKRDKDPFWRAQARFSAGEVERLIADERIPEHRRIAYAVEFLGGLRTGEASALTWRDYEPEVEPLGKLVCSAAWNTARQTLKETKTGVVKEIPVHPVLAKALGQWKLSGWPRLMRRTPKPEDLILPSTEGGHRSVNYALKTFHKDLDVLGLRRRRHYDARRTFISLALDGGASKDVLRYITHPSPADAFDLYSTPSWPARCAQVLCIHITGQRGLLVPATPLPSTQNPVSRGDMAETETG